MNVGKQPHYMHAFIMLSIHSVCGFIVKMHVYLLLRFYPYTVLHKKLTGFFSLDYHNSAIQLDGFFFCYFVIFSLFTLYTFPLNIFKQLVFDNEMFNSCKVVLWKGTCTFGYI